MMGRLQSVFDNLLTQVGTEVGALLHDPEFISALQELTALPPRSNGMGHSQIDADMFHGQLFNELSPLPASVELAA